MFSLDQEGRMAMTKLQTALQKYHGALLVSLLLLPITLLGQQAGDRGTVPRPAAKNLKLLVPDTDIPFVTRNFNQALGVQCTYCHMESDFASDHPHSHGGIFNGDSSSGTARLSEIWPRSAAQVVVQSGSDMGYRFGDYRLGGDTSLSDRCAATCVQQTNRNYHPGRHRRKHEQ
jgi:hypothetical protein